MENIFEIGGVVSGKSFIGRKKAIEKYRKEYLDGSLRVGKSIVGLTRIGKTSFARAVFSNVPENVLVIQHDLKLCDSYYSLWKKICKIIRKYLINAQIRNPYLNLLLDKIINGQNVQWADFAEDITDIFHELLELQIRTVIVLDEFDHAEQLFEGKTHYFELFRTIFSDLKVSSMLISRRQLYTIEKTTYQSSTFHGIMEPICFKGFDDIDIFEYFQVFREGGIDLSEEQKEEIEYYGGRLPYLLSIIGHYIIDTANEGGEIDITKIFLNKCNFVNRYYRDSIEHMKRDNDLERIIPFMIGPNIGVTQNDRNELINLGYLYFDDGRLITISDYFMNFFSANMRNISIWDDIINLEKKIKLLITNEMIRIIKHYSAGGKSLNVIQRNILISVKEIAPHLSMYDSFIESNKKLFNISSSYLDVISLNDSLKIVKECWLDIFSVYFNNSPYMTWDDKFGKCGRARNPVAHGHEDYLSDIEKNEINIYCQQIFDAISKSGISTPAPSEKELLAAAAAHNSVTELFNDVSFKVPVKSLLGQSVDAIIYMLGGHKKKNLRVIINKKYKGIIPRSCLPDMSPEELNRMIGKTVCVKIESISSDHYMVKYDTADNKSCTEKPEPMSPYTISDLVVKEINHIT